MTAPIILGITGASGAIYAVRLLDVLRNAGRDVHLSISASGRDVIQHELKIDIDLAHFDVSRLRLNDTEKASGLERPGKLYYYHDNDFMSPMASGSFITAGMVICPC